MKFSPRGHRLLIKPDKVEDKTESGIVLIKKAVEAEQNAQERGTVLDIGELCWSDFGDGKPWCSVGDYVVYPKYSGMKVKETIDSEEHFILVNDEDIVAVIIQDE